jgi:putative ABC transport system permease protein
MRIAIIISSSISALLAQKRRSITTIISLAWAVACFMLLMSYGQGFDVALRKGFYAIGRNIVLMASGQTSEQKGGMRAGRNIVLQESNVEEIREAVPLVAAISPEIQQNVTVVRGNRQKEYMVRAVRPEYDRIRNIQLASGRWINAEDDHYGRRVAVLGATVGKELFGNRPEFGEEILVNGTRFTVIGRLEVKVQLANYNRPDNECIFIPYQTMQLFRDIRYPNYIVWTAVTPAMEEHAIRQVRSVLAGIHRFSPTDEKAVFILAFNQFVNLIDGVCIALNVLLAFIGTITLAIGAIGLANIMFTAVIERTQEIGIMKALGATRRTILCQFLLEAVFIIIVGGAIGVGIAVLVTSAIGSLPAFGATLGEELSREYGRIYFHISAVSTVVSLSILLLVGLIAGMLPAMRASRLDPVRALHYE